MVTQEEYINNILSKYSSSVSSQTQADSIKNQLSPLLIEYGGDSIDEISLSGSFAKGTAIRGSTDVDILISFNSKTDQTLGNIYNGLYDHVKKCGYSPRKQNVSIGINISNNSVDLVPGRKQAGYVNYHSLYRNKQDSWTLTNVKEHIKQVQQSGRQNEIKALKIWRNLHNLEFPSFYLEMFTINALSGKRKGQTPENILFTLSQLQTTLENTKIVDPSNSNNIISDLLSTEKKREIASVAKNSRSAKIWDEILW